MFRKRKGVLLTLVLAISLTLSMFSGCKRTGGATGGGVKLPEGEKGKTVNETYIIKESDFAKFTEMALTGSVERKEYRVPSLTEFTVGETYYAVAYTVAKTADGSAVSFDNGNLKLLCSMSETAITGVIEITETGGTPSVSVSLKDASDKEINYSVSVSSDTSETQLYAYVKFTARAEANLSAYFTVNGAVSSGAVYNGRGAGGNISYSEKIEISGIDISFLEDKDYNDGEYDRADLKGVMELYVGKEYYIVLTAKVKTLLKQGDGGTVTINATLSPAYCADWDLEMTDSGRFEESETEGEKKISVDFRIPERDEGEKEIVFIIKLTPLAAAYRDDPSVVFGFSSDKISIAGDTLEHAALLRIVQVL